MVQHFLFILPQTPLTPLVVSSSLKAIELLLYFRPISPGSVSIYLSVDQYISQEEPIMTNSLVLSEV